MRHFCKTIIPAVVSLALVASCKTAVNPGWETGEFTLQPGEKASLSENFIRAHTDFVAEVHCDGEFSSLMLSRGDLSLFWGADLTLTSDSVKVKEFDWSDEFQLCGALEKESFAHGLALGKNILVEIKTAEQSTKAALTVKSGNQMLNREINWRGGGIPSLTNLGDCSMDVKLSFLRGSATEKVWFLADSYFSEVDPERWPYHMVAEGYAEGWMADHLPGGCSETFIGCFKNDLKYGKPQIAVWMLGMNDNDNETGISKEWLGCTGEFLGICDSLKIVPVLVTVPSVPERNHSFKTEWVRGSGRQYVDWAEAVQLEGTRQWKEGLLSPDQVHPTEAGAKVLWESVKAGMESLYQ